MPNTQLVKLSLALILLFTVGLHPCHSKTDNQNNQQLELEISIANPFLRVGDEILIVCLIKNSSKVTLNLPPILPMDLLFIAKHEDGSDPITICDKALIMVAVKEEDIVTLGPGESYTFNRRIARSTHSMPQKPGRYEMSAEYDNHMQWLDNFSFWTGKIVSNTVNFTLKDTE